MSPASIEFATGLVVLLVIGLAISLWLKAREDNRPGRTPDQINRDVEKHIEDLRRKNSPRR